MNAEVLRNGKRALNVVWVVLAASFLIPGEGVPATLRTVFVVLLGAHALELAVFGRTLAKHGGSMGHHAVQTLLYGFFHIQLVKLEAETGAAN